MLLSPEEEITDVNCKLLGIVNELIVKVQKTEEEIKMLKAQNLIRQNKSDNIFKGLKKDIKEFFSINGYSRILNTKSVFKKTFFLFFIVTLLFICIFYMVTTILDYYQYDVVTQIKSIEVETLTFPAISLCLVDYDYSVNLNSQPYFTEQFGTRFLSEILLTCNFEDKECSVDDFEHFTVYFHYETIESHLNCYKFNGGKNASNHQTKILKSTKFRALSGLILQLNMAKRDFIFYYISDNNVRPLFTELTKTIQPGKNVLVALKKTIELKLPEPYSNCKNNINSKTSHLVKQILEQNITYRKTTCYDYCLKEYANSRKMSKESAYEVSFNYQGNCSKYCPLECLSTFFDVSEDRNNFDEHAANFVWLNFFYNDNHFTEITQSIKTTVADLVSNNGGLLGLFLDLNFMSSYRMIIDAFNVFI